MMAFRFIANDDDILYLEPFFVMNDYDSRPVKQRGIALSDVNFSSGEKSSSGNFKLNKMASENSEIYEISANVNDVLVLGTKPLFDFLPPSVIAMLVNAALKERIEINSGTMANENIDGQMDAVIKSILENVTRVILAHAKNQEAVESLTKLAYLRLNIKNEDLEEDPEEDLMAKTTPGQLYDCTLYDIYYLEFPPKQNKRLLSDCMVKYIKLNLFLAPKIYHSHQYPSTSDSCPVSWKGPPRLSR
jgi:hypothetical protein